LSEGNLAIGLNESGEVRNYRHCEKIWVNEERDALKKSWYQSMTDSFYKVKD